ncbi:hypothetical protein VP14_157 [Vibrio phage VPMCC14]|nr:hypothetical protein VP14_157 [Vibrio phage VPMCC14]
MVKAPSIEDNTSLYCSAYHHQTLLMASHWVCPETGEMIKIPTGLKLVYIYRYNKHKYFTANNKQYCESHKRVADSLGMSVESVKGSYTSLLKRMGLMKSENVNTNKLHYTIYEVSDCVGWLVNPTLKNYTKDKLQKESDSKEKFTYDNLKNIEHNKRESRSIKKRSDKKFFAVEEEKMQEYRKAYYFYLNNKDKQFD